MLRCYYCNKDIDEVEDDFVSWNGRDGINLYFHANCSKRIAHTLINKANATIVRNMEKENNANQQ